MPPPDIKAAPAGSGADSATQLGGGKGMYVQIADRKDPGRVAGEITAAASEPLENKRYRLTEPRAWSFMSDGRSLHARAESGRAYIPDTGPGARPEEGSLEGDVVIRLFPPGRTRPDPEHDTPEVTARSRSLQFNGTLGELRFDEPLDLKGERFTFLARGVTILFNEVQQRLELVRVEEALGPLTVLPAPERTPGNRAAPSAPPSPAAPGSDQPAHTPQPSPPTETIYHVRCDGDVVLEQDGRTVRADRLEAWVRLLDNRLPEGAIADGSAPGARPGGFTPGGVASLRDVLAAVALAAAQPPPGNSASLAGVGSGPVTLIWTGPMEIRPLSGAGDELAANDVFVRFSSDRGDGARFADASEGLHGQGRAIEYGATRQEAAILGRAEALAEVAMRGSGRANAERFDLHLASGEARVPGPGVLLAEAPEPGVQPRRLVAWSKDAAFDFAVEDGRMTSRIREARLFGAVSARDGDATMAGESMTARFDPSREGSPGLAGVKLVGGASADDARGGSLSAETIDVAFAPREGDGEAVPTRVVAHGGVRTRREGSVLEAQSLDASLAPDEHGNPRVTAVVAQQSVRFDGADGVVASCGRLEADAVGMTAVLSGEGSSISRDATTVSGTRILLFRDSARVEVPGPGAFHHEAPGDDGIAEIADATWTGAMVFDDKAGTVEARGRVEASLERSGLERHTMSAERIEMDLSPAPEPGADGTPPADPLAPGVAGADRQLLRARLFGAPASDDSPAVPAEVSLRRYAPPLEGQPQSLERELLLTGSRIIADNQAGFIDVPTAGACRLVDVRDEQPDAPRDGPEAMAGGSRGGARFTWEESMHYTRGDGLLRMTRAVTLTHVRLADRMMTELACDDLTARIRESGEGDHANGQLESATASGSVWLRSRGKEATAAAMTYDARAGVADARAQEGATVTYLDPATGSPVEAERLVWDLVKDRVQITGIRPVVAPR